MEWNGFSTVLPYSLHTGLTYYFLLCTAAMGKQRLIDWLISTVANAEFYSIGGGTITRLEGPTIEAIGVIGEWTASTSPSARGSGERCKLHQRGLGWSPRSQTFLIMFYCLKKWPLVASVVCCTVFSNGSTVYIGLLRYRRRPLVHVYTLEHSDSHLFGFPKKSERPIRL